MLCIYPNDGIAEDWGECVLSEISIAREYLYAVFKEFVPSSEQDYCRGDAWWACIQWLL